MIRQGDITLMSNPDDEVREGGTARRIEVAHGEGGHTHVLEKARVAEGDELAMELFARGIPNEQVSPPIYVEEDTEFTHGEHDTLPVPAGTYRAIRQRQYTGKRPAPAFD